MPLTGPYSSSGKDMQLGFEMAVDHLNKGSAVTEQIPTLKKGNGVLGKKIEFQVADSETKPDPAVEAATRFIRDNKAIMLTGTVNSAVSIAIEKLGQREHVVVMIGNSGSNDTTGKDCQRYGFRAQPSAYMAAKALSPVLAKQLGNTLKAAYLVPDYTYGHSVYNSMKEFTEQAGWKTVNEQLVPLGTTDFSLLSAQYRQQRRRRLRQRGLRRRRHLLDQAGRAVRHPVEDEIRGAQYFAVPGQGAWRRGDGRHLRHPGLVVDRTGQISAGQIVRRRLREEEQLQAALGRQRGLCADAGLGRCRRARRLVLPGRRHQGAGKRPQGELDLRRGLLPRRRPPDGPPRSGDGRQEAGRDEGSGRLLPDPRTGAGRAGAAAARSDRLQDAGHRML